MRRGTYGGTVGLSGWEVLPDRWVGSGIFYPNIPSAWMDVGYFGGTGTYWDYVAQFNARSNRGVVHTDRDAIRWVFEPLVANPLYGLHVQLQNRTISSGFFANDIFIRLFVTNGPLLFDYRAKRVNEYHVPAVGGEQANNVVPAGGFIGMPNPFPPPANFPDCLFPALPVRWFEFGQRSSPFPPQVYDAFEKY